MFAESLIFVASACSNGQCPPPVVASTHYIQVQQPVVHVDWAYTFKPKVLYPLGRKKVINFTAINMPSVSICTKGVCK
jgi:hypothetical protein